MAACKLPAELASWIAQLASMLHGRVAWRLLPLLVGALFAQGRKTVASWLRGGRLGGDLWLFRAKRLEFLKKADMVCTLEVSNKRLREENHVHELTVSRLRRSRLPLA